MTAFMLYTFRNHHQRHKRQKRKYYKHYTYNVRHILLDESLNTSVVLEMF